MRWKLSALVVTCMMTISMCLPAFAAATINSLEPNATTSEVTVGGTTTNASENVIITVVPHGADITTEEGFFDHVKYQNAIQSDNGTFSHTFKLSGSGSYDMIVSAADSKSTRNFIFTDGAVAVGVINQLNAPENADKLPEVLSANASDLGLYTSEDPTPNWTAVAATVKKALPLDAADPGKTISFLKQTVQLQYATDGAVNNIFDYDIDLKIYDADTKGVFKGLFTEANEKATTKLLKGTAYADKTAFDKAVVEKMILAFIESPDGAGNAQTVMEAYASLIGIDTTDVGTATYVPIINKSYTSLDKLKEAFNLAVNPDAGEEDDDDDDDNRRPNRRDDSSTYYLPVVPGNNTTEPAKGFNDLAGFEWAVESIEGLASTGVVSGKSPNMYFPADRVTRSEYVKMLIGALGITGADKAMNFSDVAPGAWDYNYIQIAYSNNIIDGLGDGTFGGNQFITRQDMAVIMHRAMKAIGKTLPEASGNLFADDAAIAGYAREAAYVLRAANVFNGDENNNMDPLNLANRAEAAKVIYSVVK